MQIFSMMLQGHLPYVVAIEASFTSGYGGIQMVGNVSEICRDGRDRAKASLEYLGWTMPSRRILVSFNPGDLRKDGSQFDLGLAVVLAALWRDEKPNFLQDDVLFVAELSLKGELLGVPRIIPLVLEAIHRGFRYLVIARDNLEELRPLWNQISACHQHHQLEILAADHLSSVLHWCDTGERTHLTSLEVLAETSFSSQKDRKSRPKDFSDMHLSPALAELAILTAAGRHSLLLRGSPGTGKTMFAERIPSLLGSLDAKTHLDTLRIYSLSSTELPAAIVQGAPPFRAPHHTSSAQAITGTEKWPGELSLAHGGVLFLDELNEFRRDILESLREPMESGVVEISRAKHKARWLARPLLLAACNNCPCGWWQSRIRRCECAPSRLKSYFNRLSGPLLQRFDLHFMMPEESMECGIGFLQSGTQQEIAAMQDRVRRVEVISFSRNACWGVRFNHEIPGRFLAEALGYSPDTLQKKLNALSLQGCTQRSLIRMLRVARTIADMESESVVREDHLRRASVFLPGEIAKQLGQRNQIVTI